MKTAPVVPHSSSDAFRLPRRSRTLVGAVLAVIVAQSALSAAKADAVKLTSLDDRVRIEIGGKLFSEYRFRGAPKPCLFPILDAEGVSYTRNWPMKETPDEVHDHDWHRSVWFGHGLVNGHDFWREIPERKTGTIVHDKILERRDGPEGLLRVASRWVAADGQVICTDETSIRIRRTDAGTFLDYEVALKASHGPLVFGDTEEGTMAVRVNEAIRVSHGKKKEMRRGTGHIVNSAGDRDTPAWGKRAAWCDYFGPLPDGRVIGVAIFDHPKNPTHPTWWHVRDYGLFAANPFGRHDFEKLKDENAGNIAVPAGGELVLRYRILFHRGDERTARIAEHYREYTKAGQ
jgi:hypothetical protein